MKWTVTWKPSAQHDLAEIWLRSLNRRAITLAAAEIERLLLRDPLGVGESRDKDERLLIIFPLAVRYKVFPDDLLVSVQETWTIVNV